MRRKIVGQGAGAKTIILPIKWVRKSGLDTGSEVEIQEEGLKLIISPTTINPKVKEKEVFIRTNNLKHVKEVISSLYKAGYEVIILKFSEEIDIIKLQNIVDSFTGLDLLVEDTKTIRVQSFLRISTTDIENLIRKLFQTVQLIGDMILNDFSKVNIESINLLARSNAEKLANHCIRSIQQTNYGETAMEVNINIVRELLRIALDMSYLAQFIKENDIKTSSIWKKYMEFYTETRKMFSPKNFEMAEEIYHKHRMIVTELFSSENISSTLKSENSGLMAHQFLLFMHLRNVEGHLFSLALFKS